MVLPEKDRSFRFENFRLAICTSRQSANTRKGAHKHMRRIRIGVIGAGWWAAENHIPVLKSFPDVEIAGICRLGKEDLRKLQERFGISFGIDTLPPVLCLLVLLLV